MIEFFWINFHSLRYNFWVQETHESSSSELCTIFWINWTLNSNEVIFRWRQSHNFYVCWSIFICWMNYYYCRFFQIVGFSIFLIITSYTTHQEWWSKYVVRFPWINLVVCMTTRFGKEQNIELCQSWKLENGNRFHLTSTFQCQS